MELKTYLADLEYLTNIDSGSDNVAGVTKVADFFESRFKELGWNVEKADLAPNAGPCLFCTNRKAEQYDVMLIGHMDTVFLDGTCAQRPYRTDGTNAYGPGVSDMKQGSLLMYWLMHDLPEEVNDKLNILCVFNPDEEIGSKFSKSVYEPWARKSKYCYVYEPHFATGERCVRRKGSVVFFADFTGKAGHCGFVFDNGARSAVSEMAKWIVKLDSLQSRERDTSVNIGLVEGGTKVNVVADHARMTFDMRFILPEEAENLKKTVEELQKQAEANGIGVEFSGIRFKHPMVPSAEGEAYIAHITEVAKQNGMDYVLKTRGGTSDGNIISQMGPICLDSMGVGGAGGHSEKEFMQLDDIMPTYDLSMLFLKDMAENK